jgi:hypothetical protein
MTTGPTKELTDKQIRRPVLCIHTVSPGAVCSSWAA